jgi:lipopolysaccharide transport system ATP-binding protein
MKRVEIQRKFDEIVAFSEIEKFIDTPVKFYSSGMYLRLAFSVSAHLEPEILILDEVLSVGDTAFQLKCFKKMEEIRNAGSTVLYVSHSMTSVTKLCKRVMLFSEGAIVREGPAEEIAKAYLGAGVKLSAERIWNNLDEAPGDDVARLRAVRVRLEDGQVTSHIDIRKPVGIEMEFEVLQPGHVLVPNIRFQNEEGLCIFHVGDIDTASQKRLCPCGVYLSTMWVPGNFLSEGTISAGAAVTTPEPLMVHFYEQDAVAFKVVDNLEGGSARGDSKGPYPGVVRPILNWTTQCNLNESGDLEVFRAEAISES